MGKSKFIIMVDDSPCVYGKNEDGSNHVLSFDSRTEAWEAVRDDTAQIARTYGMMDDECECDDESAELCDLCTLDSSIRDILAEADTEKPDMKIHSTIGYGFIIEVIPATHYHCYRDDHENSGEPHPTLRSALQRASELALELAEECSERASVYGNMADRALKDKPSQYLSQNQTANEWYATAYLLLREASELDATSANLDMERRSKAPLFQGKGGAENLRKTMEHLDSTMLPIRASNLGRMVHLTQCNRVECYGDIEG